MVSAILCTLSAIIVLCLSAGLVVNLRKIDRFSDLHEDYLKKISRVNNLEISDHIYDYNWRYEWLAERRAKWYGLSMWAKCWSRPKSCFEDIEKVLERRTQEDRKPTLELVPGYIKRWDDE